MVDLGEGLSESRWHGRYHFYAVYEDVPQSVCDLIGHRMLHLDSSQLHEGSNLPKCVRTVTDRAVKRVGRGALGDCGRSMALQHYCLRVSLVEL